MLAVKEGYRNTGLGRRIKLFQREDAIARGYELMEWTFDPLEIKNSYFNLERLGAIARRYNINQYGITTSPLQGFLPTDRLVAEWWLKSRRVETAAGERTSRYLASRAADRGSGRDLCMEGRSPTMRGEGARECRLRNRELLQAAFCPRACRAWATSAMQSGNGCFPLGRWDENWSYTSNA